MPVAVTKLQRDTRTLSVPWDADTLNLVYRPGSVTPDLVEAVAQPEVKQPVVTFLLATVQSWDLLDDADKPLPVTEGLLSELPMLFLRAVQTAILEDLQVPKARS
jgi:hypothetical protein